MGLEERSPIRKDYLIAAAVVLRQAREPGYELDAYDEAVIERAGVVRDPRWLQEELTIFAREYDRADLDLLVHALGALAETRDPALVPVYRQVLGRYIDRSVDVIQQVLLALEALGEVDTRDHQLIFDLKASYHLASGWLRGDGGGEHN